jgi:hypothetical protein
MLVKMPFAEVVSVNGNGEDSTKTDKENVSAVFNQ